MTGSVADAEDAVQESWLRLSGSDADTIADLRGWLTTVVARICLDRLKSAAVRRESYVGQWLPEPIATSPSTQSNDPLDLLVRDEDARLAALVVLDTLSPAQRVAFVLHDGFSVPFDEVADILGVSSSAARQLAARARKHVDAAPEPVTSTEHNEAVGRLMEAMASGDLTRVVAALHPDCRTIGDSGGTTRTAARVILGPDKCARFYLGLVSMYGAGSLSSMAPAMVNGSLGYYSSGSPGDDDHRSFPGRVGGFTVRDGLVWAAYDFANPSKLGGVAADLLAMSATPPPPTAPGTQPPS